MTEPVDRYVDALLRRKRPKPFAPTQDDVEILAVAIDLAAGASGETEPRPAFVEQLRARLEQQQPGVEQSGASRPAWRLPARRRVLAAGALTVTGAAAGALGANLLAAGTAAQGAAAASTAPPPLIPDRGSWQAVLASAQLSEGAVLPFDLGSVTGFVRRTAGRVQAVSGTCTHQGCRLELTDTRQQYACPCHGATFNLAGVNLTHPRLTTGTLPALPRLPVREQNARIEIYAPSPPTPST